MFQSIFSVRTVVSEESVERMGAKLDALISRIDDPDVAGLMELLQSTPEDCRFDMGMMSLWGYPKEFVERLIETKQLGDLSIQLSKAKMKINNALLNFLRGKINNLVLSEITTKNQFSPLAIQVAAQVLTGRVLDKFQVSSSGKVLAGIDPNAGKRGNLVQIKNELLETGGQVLKNDFSELEGEGELLALKVNLARHIYAGFNTVEEMAEKLDKDWVRLEPIVANIEVKLEEFIPKRSIVVLRDTDWFDNTDYLKKVIEGMAAYDQKLK